MNGNNFNEKKFIGPTEWAIHYAVEVNIDQNDFLKIAETLTRIGIANHKDKVLTQTCHIFQKMGKYYITHFKELLALDGKPVNIDSEDILRRNRIVSLLEEWGMVKVVDRSKIEHQSIPTSFTILPFSEKKGWTLKAKYQIGKF